MRTEVEALTAVLERNRRTFAWKTADLDEQGMRATTAVTTMTLGGLIKHVALVEADWLAVKLAGQTYGPPWDAVDFDADPDWEWRTGAADTPEDVYAVWRAAVDRSRVLVVDVVEDRGLDGPASFSWPDGRTPTVRDMLLDMIEEYARHTGHADLLREGRRRPRRRRRAQRVQDLAQATFVDLKHPGQRHRWHYRPPIGTRSRP